MLVTSTVVELETLRAHLLGEVTRIRGEYERLPDIEEDVAALDRILRHATAEGEIEAEPPAEVAVTLSDPASDLAEALPLAPADTVAESLPGEPAGTSTDASAVPASIRTPRGPNWKRELAGLGQREAVIKIAARIGTTVTVAQVARILVETALTQSSGMQAQNRASDILSGSDLFERVRRGVYRLRVQTEPVEPEPPSVEPPAFEFALKSKRNQTLADHPSGSPSAHVRRTTARPL